MRYVTGAAKSNRLKLFAVFSATALNFGVKFYMFMCFCRTWYIIGIRSRQSDISSVSSLLFLLSFSYRRLSSPFDVARGPFRENRNVKGLLQSNYFQNIYLGKRILPAARPSLVGSRSPIIPRPCRWDNGFRR